MISQKNPLHRHCVIVKLPKSWTTHSTGIFVLIDMQHVYIM